MIKKNTFFNKVFRGRVTNAERKNQKRRRLRTLVTQSLESRQMLAADSIDSLIYPQASSDAISELVTTESHIIQGVEWDSYAFDPTSQGGFDAALFAQAPVATQPGIVSLNHKVQFEVAENGDLQRAELFLNGTVVGLPTLDSITTSLSECQDVLGPDAPGVAGVDELATDIASPSYNVFCDLSNLDDRIVRDSLSSTARIEIDVDADGQVDLTSLLNFDGSFTQRLDRLDAGDHQVQVRPSTWNMEQGDYSVGNWQTHTIAWEGLPAPMPRNLRVAEATPVTLRRNITGELSQLVDGLINSQVHLDLDGDKVVDESRYPDAEGLFAFPIPFASGEISVRTSAWNPKTETQVLGNWSSLSFEIPATASSELDAHELTASVTSSSDDSGYDDSGYDDSGYDDSGYDDSGYDDSGSMDQEDGIPGDPDAGDDSPGTATDNNAGTNNTGAGGGDQTAINAAQAEQDASIAEADAAYEAANESARLDFIAAIANYGGNSTSFEFEPFTWPNAPTTPAVEIPADSHQPAPPHEIPTYTGPQFDFPTNAQYQSELSELNSIHQQSVTAANDARTQADIEAHQRYDQAVQAARSSANQDLANLHALFNTEFSTPPATDIDASRDALNAAIQAARDTFNSEGSTQQSERNSATDSAATNLQGAADSANATYIAAYQTALDALNLVLDASPAPSPAEKTQAWEDYRQTLFDAANVRDTAIANAKHDYEIGVIDGNLAMRDAIIRARRELADATHDAQEQYDKDLAKYNKEKREIESGAIRKRDSALSLHANNSTKAESNAKTQLALDLIDNRFTEILAIKAAERTRDHSKAVARRDALQGWNNTAGTPWKNYQLQLVVNELNRISSLNTARETLATSVTAAEKAHDVVIVNAKHGKIVELADFRNSQLPSILETNGDFDADTSDVEYDADLTRIALEKNLAEARAQADQTASEAGSSAADAYARAMAGARLTYRLTMIGGRRLGRGVSPGVSYNASAAFTVASNNALLALRIAGLNSGGAMAKSMGEAQLDFEAKQADDSKLENNELSTANKDRSDDAAGLRYDLSVATVTAEVAMKNTETAAYVTLVDAIAPLDKTFDDESVRLVGVHDVANAEALKSFYVDEASHYETTVSQWDSSESTPWTQYHVRRGTIEGSWAVAAGTAIVNHASSVATAENNRQQSFSTVTRNRRTSSANAYGTREGAFGSQQIAFVTAIADAHLTVEEEDNGRKKEIEDLEEERKQEEKEKQRNFIKEQSENGIDANRDHAIAMLSVNTDYSNASTTARGALMGSVGDSYETLWESTDYEDTENNETAYDNHVQNVTDAVNTYNTAMQTATDTYNTEGNTATDDWHDARKTIHADVHEHNASDPISTGNKEETDDLEPIVHAASITAKNLADAVLTATQTLANNRGATEKTYSAAVYNFDANTASSMTTAGNLFRSAIATASGTLERADYVAESGRQGNDDSSRRLYRQQAFDVLGNQYLANATSTGDPIARVMASQAQAYATYEGDSDPQLNTYHDAITALNIARIDGQNSAMSARVDATNSAATTFTNATASARANYYIATADAATDLSVTKTIAEAVMNKALVVSAANLADATITEQKDFDGDIEGLSDAFAEEVGDAQEDFFADADSLKAWTDRVWTDVSVDGYLNGYYFNSYTDVGSSYYAHDYSYDMNVGAGGFWGGSYGYGYGGLGGYGGYGIYGYSHGGYGGYGHGSYGGYGFGGYSGYGHGSYGYGAYGYGGYGGYGTYSLNGNSYYGYGGYGGYGSRSYCSYGFGACSMGSYRYTISPTAGGTQEDRSDLQSDISSAEDDFVDGFNSSFASLVQNTQTAMIAAITDDGEARITLATALGDADKAYATAINTAETNHGNTIQNARLAEATSQALADRLYDNAIHSKSHVATTQRINADEQFQSNIAQPRIHRAEKLATAEAIHHNQVIAGVAFQTRSIANATTDPQAQYDAAYNEAKQSWIAEVSSDFVDHKRLLATAQMAYSYDTEVARGDLDETQSGVDKTQAASAAMAEQVSRIADATSYKTYRLGALPLENDRRLDDAQAERSRQIDLRTAEKVQAVDLAEANKTRAVDQIGDDDPDATATAYRESVADAELAYVTDTADANLQWHKDIANSKADYVTAYTPIEHAFEQADATRVHTYTIAVAASKQIQQNARTTTGVNFYTQHTLAGNVLRSSAAVADVGLMMAKADASITGTQHIDDNMNLPWTDFLVGLASGQRVALTGVGTLQIALAATRNTNIDAYATTVNNATQTNQTTLIGATQTHTVTLSTVSSTRSTARNDARRDHLVNLATPRADYSKNTAQATRNKLVAIAQAQRDFAFDEDASARDTSIATANSDHETNQNATDQAWRTAEANAKADLYFDYATAERNWSVNTATADAVLARQRNNSERDYRIQHVDASLASAILWAGDDASYFRNEAALIGSVISTPTNSTGGLSGTPSPWSIYDSATRGNRTIRDIVVTDAAETFALAKLGIQHTEERNEALDEHVERSIEVNSNETARHDAALAAFAFAGTQRTIVENQAGVNSTLPTNATPPTEPSWLTESGQNVTDQLVDAASVDYEAERWNSAGKAITARMDDWNYDAVFAWTELKNEVDASVSTIPTLPSTTDNTSAAAPDGDLANASNEDPGSFWNTANNLVTTVISGLIDSNPILHAATTSALLALTLPLDNARNYQLTGSRRLADLHPDTLVVFNEHPEVFETLISKYGSAYAEIVDQAVRYGFKFKFDWKLALPTLNRLAWETQEIWVDTSVIGWGNSDSHMADQLKYSLDKFKSKIGTLDKSKLRAGSIGVWWNPKVTQSEANIIAREAIVSFGRNVTIAVAVELALNAGGGKAIEATADTLSQYTTFFRVLRNAENAPNNGGRGLIGLVKPGGTLDDALRANYIAIARSPQFAKSVERYNKLAKFLGQKPSASIDDIVKALGDDVTFSKIGHLKSGVFTPGTHPGKTKFWLQGNPTTAYGQRVGRHELTHLGAALRGQGDNVFHELAVQAVTTPENLVIFSTGFVIVIGGEAYWVFSQ